MNLHEKISNMTYKDAIIVLSYTALLVLGIIYFQDILKLIGTFFGIITPFIVGIILAFIFNIPMKFFFKKLSIKNEKKKKIIASLLSITLFLLIIIVIFIVVLPHVVENVSAFIKNLPQGLKQLDEGLDYILSQFHVSEEVIQKVEELKNNLGYVIVEEMTSLGPSIAVGMTHLTTGVFHIFMGIVTAVYILLSKDQLMRQIQKLGSAFLSKGHYQQVQNILSLTSSTFESFVAGQLTESIIIGVLCYFGCILLDIPYASIAAIVIGFTNIIPYFGPIIGASLCSLLILCVSPVKMIVFLIFSTLLQQCESNLIYPHVVGSSVGLSPLWVLCAVSIGGGLFGISGMVFGLPVFSIIYEFIRRWTYQRLEKSNLFVD